MILNSVSTPFKSDDSLDPFGNEDCDDKEENISLAAVCTPRLGTSEGSKILLNARLSMKAWFAFLAFNISI
jgi:hypothetical protein